MFMHVNEGGNNDAPEGFPKWRYSHFTAQKMESSDRRVRISAMRSSASAFIKKDDVRACIFNNKGRSCYLCGEYATQIDHKIPVALFADGASLDYRRMNDYDNLFPICQKCNSSRAVR